MAAAMATGALPGFAATTLGGVAGATGGVLDSTLAALGSNPYIIGLMMVIMNLGGRFLGMEVSRTQERWFQHPWMRRFLLFVVIFIGTRNLQVAFFLTILVSILLALVNEKSMFYIFGGDEGAGGGSGTGAQPPTATMSVEEVEILRRLSEKQARMQGAGAGGDKTSAQRPQPPPSELVYVANMTALK